MTEPAPDFRSHTNNRCSRPWSLQEVPGRLWAWRDSVCRASAGEEQQGVAISSLILPQRACSGVIPCRHSTTAASPTNCRRISSGPGPHCCYLSADILCISAIQLLPSTVSSRLLSRIKFSIGSPCSALLWDCTSFLYHGLQGIRPCPLHGLASRSRRYPRRFHFRCQQALEQVRSDTKSLCGKTDKADHQQCRY